MIFLNLILIYLLSVTADKNSNDGYCDAGLKTCKNPRESIHDKKLIFYDVNPSEGFNLRRDVYIRFAIMLTHAKMRRESDWRLVLPPWHNLYHWKSTHLKSKPQFWSDFFELESLKTFAPVLDTKQVLDKTKNKRIKIDTLYVLQNFENPFENGVFEEKWQFVRSKCEYEGNFWGLDKFEVKETVCVQFQGKISKLWELISQHPSDRNVMFMHGEIPLHDNYGSKSYWDCRKSMKFNKSLVKTAKKFIDEELNCRTDKCSNYFAIHWRRRDFACSRPNDVPSLPETVKQLKDAVLEHMSYVTKVFIATDAAMAELRELISEIQYVGLEPYVYQPSESDLKEFKDGGVAIIDQIICSHAAYFIGTHDSTFSFRIQEEREILGFNSNTTFNRFCPDTGPCEKPSVWKIIN